jgi:predicted ribosome quality control (RQC) complex YloA/Tae2 family protein
VTTKHHLLERLIALSFAGILLIANVKAYAQDAAVQTKSEIERMQQSLKAQPIQSPDLADLGKRIEQRLKEADSARSVGRLYLSLENLGQAEDYFHAVRTIEAKGDAVKDNLPAFEAEWGKASLEYAALDKQARQRDWAASLLPSAHSQNLRKAGRFLC